MPGFDDFQKLLDSYTVRPIGADEPPTLMEIAGVPHWENVYSNILAFLLDSAQVHGFKQLFIRSIMAVYRSRCPEDWPEKDLDFESVHATERVEREVCTATDKRIDILVECADFVVCIENKIWSGLHNDLGDYRRHCEALNDGGRNRVVGIVLSPDSVTDPILQDHRFVGVTYGSLVDEVRRRMGSYIGSQNTKYQYLLFDFLDQASRLSRTNTMSDDQREFLEFWRKNEEKISNIQSRCDEMWSRMQEMARAHVDQCREQLIGQEREAFEMWIHNRSVSVFDLADQGEIDGCGLFLDVEFHPLRVSHSLGKRRGCEPAVLAFRIGGKCAIDFFKESSDRPTVTDPHTPFDESVRERAVKTSVDILKAIAAMR